ncbi:MAG: hypothetical protein VW771_06765 [Gammaproteobacteria bacterium]
MRLSLQLALAIGVNLLVSIYSFSHASLESLGKEAADFWLAEASKPGDQKRSRCWRSSKNQAIENASQLLREMEVSRWLLATDELKKRSNYEVLEALASQGLNQRLKNNGFVRISSSTRSDGWDEITFEGEAGVRRTFLSLKTSSAQELLAAQEERFADLMRQALAECRKEKNPSIASVSALNYLLVPFMTSTTVAPLIDIVLEEYWTHATNNSKEKWAALSRFCQLTSLLTAAQKKELSKSVSAEVKESLMNDIADRTQASLDRDRDNARLALIKVWRYVVAQEMLSPSQSLAKKLKMIPDGGTDPLISFDLGETIGLLVLANDLTSAGRAVEAAKIIRTLILYELGTSNTGLRLTRPIDERNRVITPYPIWMALAPAYYELTSLMTANSGQLTAEQYKNTRSFSRDQYVSGVIEEGFWKHFENVVN